MTKHAEIVTNLQQAGAKTYEALSLTSKAVESAKLEFTQLVMSDPVAEDIDAQFRMVQDLAALEQSLKTIEKALEKVYNLATDISGISLRPAEVQVIRGTARESLRIAQNEGKVLDADSKLTKAAVATWSFLQGHLSESESKHVTHQQIAIGSKIPVGTVGASLARLLKNRYIVGSPRKGYMKLR